MTEQQLRELASGDIVHLVTNDRQFHLVTIDPRFCNPQQAPQVMLGWVACWCLKDARWHAVNPADVFAYQAVGHTESQAVTAPDAPDSGLDPLVP